MLPILSSLKGKWQKVVTLRPERGPLGFSLMFPASVKAESPHHEGSKANRAAAKHSH